MKRRDIMERERRRREREREKKHQSRRKEGGESKETDSRPAF